MFSERSAGCLLTSSNFVHHYWHGRASQTHLDYGSPPCLRRPCGCTPSQQKAKSFTDVRSRWYGSTWHWCL